jgi:hypothetical protein
LNGLNWTLVFIPRMRYLCSYCYYDCYILSVLSRCPAIHFIHHLFTVQYTNILRSHTHCNEVLSCVSCIRCTQPTNDVVFCGNRFVFLLLPRSVTVRQARDLGTPVRIAEECNALASGNEALGIGDFLGGWGDHTVKSRAKDIVTPTCQQVARIHDDSSRLIYRVIILNNRCHKRCKTYDGWRWLELLGMGILHLKSTDLKRDGLGPDPKSGRGVLTESWKRRVRVP